MQPTVHYFNLTGLHQPVAFIDSESLYPILYEILRDWKMEKAYVENNISPGITIEKTKVGYKRQSNWLSEPVTFRDPVDAICDLIVDLIRAYISDNKGLLCLHCSAVKIADGLIVFPNTYRSGKSTMSIELVSRGACLYSDDVLPIEKNGDFGLAMGILPRLRLPLPNGVNKHFTNFIAKHTGPKNSRYLYVNLNLSEQEALGATAPIRGITILQREQNAKPQLLEVKKSIVLKDMILRNFARQNPGIEIVDRVYSIVEKAECFKLIYDDLDKAADLIIAAFSK